MSSSISIDTNVSGSANCCHVCLTDFKPGDVVTSSKNKKCSHMFHESCIVDWLLGPHDNCPVCRNDFLVSHMTIAIDEVPIPFTFY